ncbi:MAG: hypothetical protein MJ232_06725, partial [archaeon]|nr:hypothetical protein [archaeon]
MKYNNELVKLENVKILGYTSEIENIPEILKKVDSINPENKTIQLINADGIAGIKHIQHGIIHAIKAFERGENLAKDLGIEILLRTSGQRQISKAFNILGLKEGKMNIAIVMIDCSDDLVNKLDTIFNRNDKVSTYNNRMKFFIEHSKNTINYLYNHPSIIIYTIFNEGWGQFNADELYTQFKSLDAFRLYDATSGWFKQNSSDFDSEHVYFRNKKLNIKTRPFLLSECGG